MYTFGCQDTTTVIMDYLSRKEIRPLLCLNKDFYNIRNNGYYSIRVIQDFIKKNKKLKCHENKYYCTKIKLNELLKNSEKYIGKTIQFIIKRKYVNPKSYILWHCKFGGSTINPLTFFPHPPYHQRQGIVAVHTGYINQNIYSNCSCDANITKLDNNNAFTFFGRNHDIYEHSLRIIE